MSTSKDLTKKSSKNIYQCQHLQKVIFLSGADIDKKNPTLLKKKCWAKATLVLFKKKSDASVSQPPWKGWRAGGHN
jgi:hypothetical protein